jgi:chaperonin GroES
VEVRPGDRVIFGKFAGTEVGLNGQEFLVLREDEILGVIQPDNSEVQHGKEHRV